MPALREQVALAFFGKGNNLAKLGRGKEAVAVYSNLVERFGRASEPALRELVAQALFNKGFTLSTLGHNNGASKSLQRKSDPTGHIVCYRQWNFSLLDLNQFEGHNAAQSPRL
jgi:hypothetical protein